MSKISNQELVENNINLVYYIVHHYYPTFINDEDVVQSGMLGLCKAADKWDENRGKFSTFAGRCIRNEINKEFIKRKQPSKMISLDTTIGEDGTLADILMGDDDIAYVDDSFLHELDKEERQILAMDNMGYSTDEISELSGYSIHKTRKILRMIRLKWRKANEIN